MEPGDTLQHLPEYLPGYCHLSKLKHQPPGMPHQMSTILMSLVCTLRSDQCFTDSGKVSLLMKLPRL